MIVIVDYGIGNIFNILKCLKSLNKKIIVSNNEKEILNSNFLILPGVGSFGYAAAKLKKSNLSISCSVSPSLTSSHHLLHALLSAHHAFFHRFLTSLHAAFLCRFSLLLLTSCHLFRLFV